MFIAKCGSFGIVSFKREVWYLVCQALYVGFMTFVREIHTLFMRLASLESQHIAYPPPPPPRNEKLLLRIALGISSVWVITQIVLIVCFWGYPQRDDMANYIYIAERCFNAGQWYPMEEDVYSIYIVTPGLINYLILQLKIFGTVNFNAVLNLFLNFAMLLEAYYLGKKFFSKRIGFISMSIFCLLPSNLLIVLGANTENTFQFLCLSALCLVFSGKWKYTAIAALLFAIANWVRPLAIIFLFASAVYFFIIKAKFYNYIALLIPYILVLFIIGTVTEKKIGYFVYQSTTGGFNLLMTSNDNSTGAVVFPSSNDTITFFENHEKTTFAEKDSIWRERSFKWIKEHPAKFAYLYFRKIFLLYANDSWPYASHFYWDSGIIKHGYAGILKDKIMIIKALRNSLLSIPYYLAFLFFFYALWSNRKEIFSIKSIFLVILITGTIITCIFPAMSRYHYPFMPTIIIYAAWGIDTLIEHNFLHYPNAKKTLFFARN
jgi:hypothetical protein